MKEHSQKLFAKALDTVEGAEGLLYEIGLVFSQHGQVIAAYGKHFAKTKELDPKFHHWLRGGFDTRISGDYDVDAEISNQLAANLINQAREFLEAAREYLENKPNEE